MRSYFFGLLILIFLLPLSKAIGQESQLTFSGKYQNTPFEVFVKDVEARLPVYFFYHPAIMDSIYVTADFNNASLERALTRVFRETDIHFMINTNNQVIISKEFEIVSELPENYFEPYVTSSPRDDSQVIDLFEQEERIEEELNVLENTIIEIGPKSIIVDGQNANIAGHIRDAATGEPLVGALVYIENPRIGVATDQYGFYSISLPKGRRELLLQYIGYKDTKRQLIVYAEGKLDIEMQEAIIPLKEVVIESEKDINVTGLQTGLEKIDIQSMKNVPPIMGEVDIMRVALTLPGVQSVGEGANGINVRGGTTDQNLMLINDAPIYNPSHFFGFFSAFNPDVIKSAELHKGGIQAQYGGRISSVFEVQAKEGNFRNFVGSGGISPVTGRLMLEGPILKDKLSYIIAGRSTYSNWILKQLPDPAFKNSSASFYDFFGKFTYNLNDKNSLYLAGYFSDDKFKFNADTAYQYQNENLSLQWKHIFNNKLYAVFSGTYSGYNYNVSSDRNELNAFKLGYSIENYGGKMDFSWYPFASHKIDFGINSLAYKLNPGNYQPEGDLSIIIPEVLENEQGIENAIYIGDKYEINNRWSLYAGLRYSYYNYLGPKTVAEYAPGLSLDEDSKTGETVYDKNESISEYHGPELRLSSRYALNDFSSIKVSYNRMRQYIHMLSNTTSISPTDIWKLSDKYIPPQVGDQYTAGYYRNLKNNTIEASVEAYFKTINDMLDFKSGAELILNENIETDVVNGLGRSYGVEFLVKKKTGKLNGWVSYTYSRALIKVDSENKDEVINNGEFYPASYDKPHALNILSNYRFSRRLSLSGNVTYSTGRPITIPLAKYNYFGTQRLHYSDRNQFRIPDYFRLDLSLNIEGNHKVKKLNHSSWTVAIYNLTGRKNPYSVYFVSENGKINGYKLSIFAQAIPTVTYNFRF